jgi:hypothetical protein
MLVFMCCNVLWLSGTVAEQMALSPNPDKYNINLINKSLEVGVCSPQN